MNKRAINQIEYIAAMLIFIFGLIVVMYFVLTFDIAQRQDYLTTIENNFKKQVEMNYEIYYLSVQNLDRNCFIVDLPENVNLDYLTIISGNEKIGFQDIDNDKISVNGDNGNYQFFIVDGYQYQISDLEKCQEISSDFSIKEKKTALNYSKIWSNSNLNIEYYQNYDSLKTTIAEGKDFTIEFENIGECKDNGDDIKIPGLNRYVPHNAQVTAGKFPAKIFVRPDLICDVNVLIKIW